MTMKYIDEMDREEMINELMEWIQDRKMLDEMTDEALKELYEEMNDEMDDDSLFYPNGRDDD